MKVLLVLSACILFLLLLFSTGDFKDVEMDRNYIISQTRATTQTGFYCLGLDDCRNYTPIKEVELNE